MFNRLRVGLACAFLCAGAVGHAQLRLGSPFQDHMVLQRDRAVAIWGWAKPGTKISIKSSWGSVGEAEADKAGKWLGRLNTPKGGGGPYDVTINGDGQITLDDVLVGEVWVCSGQSNMEMTVQKGYPPSLLNQELAIAGAQYPRIRMFNVVKNMAATPQELCGGEWQVCTPQTVGSFSAAGYFFAQRLFEQLRVPIGMIHTSWGGTEVELWTSESGLRTVPELGEKLDTYKKTSLENQATLTKWNADLLASDIGNGKWQAVDLDEADWTSIPGPLKFEEVGLSQFDGFVWVRCRFNVPAEMTVNSVRLDLGPIDDIDTAFVNGTLVGATGSFNVDRKYDVPKDLVRLGENVVAVRVLDTGGAGGFGGPNVEVRVNNDLVVKLTDWKWKASTDLSKFAKPVLQPAKAFSTLYNGMIAPLLPYTMKGAIWYQGESNVGRAYQYRKAFPAMIRDWRSAWGLGDFPFFYVQIAPFNYGNGMSPELREAQLLAMREPNTGMVVTTDITDDVKDIHPINKQDVGLRLAQWALNKCYAKHKIVPSGPIYTGMRVEGEKIRVFFDYIGGGLIAAGPELTHFEVAGADRKFYPAKAVIERDQVVVSSDQVAKPVAVRFGWGDAAIPNLFNKALLPASPFRSDDWPGLTDKNRW
ncbi:MAG: hypothetical protein KF784_02655 [Fimbriimonadaceae bacterium]|nr:hypothetical protein [Fimbriimonadaceae bacterium]